jgi:uncharacterized protein YfcZ (UPF0381/DUF406 family)
MLHHQEMSGIAILNLQRAGFTEQQVEALAEYHEAGAATKSDIANLDRKIETVRSEIEIKLSDLDHKIDATRADLEGRLSELDNKLDRTRSDLELAIEKVRHDLELRIAEGKAETIRWVVGGGFAQMAMILTVLRLFPSVHP